MRNEKEMFDLILGVATGDERVRAVVLNGSRANPQIPKDAYQDYDVIYLVTDMDGFRANLRWIDVFGERLMLQMPEAMRSPSGKGHFTWMMLLKDGNRIDLTLIPLEKLELMGKDSLNVILLDKDGLLPLFPKASDKDYWVKPPCELHFSSCCNNFWWCMQNIAKGLARDELPYAMGMYCQVVRPELHDMIDWYIGSENNFKISTGKMGKYYKQYLSEDLYLRYCATYPNSQASQIWAAMEVMSDLFHDVALKVARHAAFTYPIEDEMGMRAYIGRIKKVAWGQ